MSMVEGLQQVRELPLPDLGLSFPFRTNQTCLRQSANLTSLEIDTRQKRLMVSEHLWSQYLQRNGRDIALVKDTKLLRWLLIRTGAYPSRLRADLWMLFTGAVRESEIQGWYQEFYSETLTRTSPVGEEIEKDVRRSLPENPAFQSSIGLNTLRRVLVAYSVRNTQIGYAQGFNIISAVLLLLSRKQNRFPF
ncbi:RabGAP/TBC [Gonapodya prolifera JEL478]|uniref:RabGAP/TBC n=1 Tax=Gonapodya prolifera (strain JEL478) TaxID=1344416 RepID=A0A139AET4_GONPJ|nr:RabGAP/TBC [Gonapodya prolifera JEL478]|eukprot:KXS15332.1 RabGAP/TBC [Gonapodya prolifera JEL478]